MKKTETEGGSPPPPFAPAATPVSGAPFPPAAAPSPAGLAQAPPASLGSPPVNRPQPSIAPPAARKIDPTPRVETNANTEGHKEALEKLCESPAKDSPAFRTADALSDALAFAGALRRYGDPERPSLEIAREAMASGNGRRAAEMLAAFTSETIVEVLALLLGALITNLGNAWCDAREYFRDDLTILLDRAIDRPGSIHVDDFRSWRRSQLVEKLAQQRYEIRRLRGVIEEKCSIPDPLPWEQK